MPLNAKLRYRMILLLSLILAVTVLGAVGMHLLEGWGWLDSFYACVVTLATIGYGDMAPKTPQGKLFVMGLIIVGLGLISYTVVELTAFIVEGNLGRLLRARMTDSKVKALRGHYVVCGAGATGLRVAEELAKNKVPFVVLDKDPLKLEQPLVQGHPHLLGDATDDALLEQAGLAKASGLAACLPSDEMNVFITLSAKALHPGLRVVCKCEHQGARSKMIKAGADAVVAPTTIGGLRIASEMLRPSVVSFLDLMLRDTRGMRFEEAVLGSASPHVGKTLASLRLMETLGLNVVALRDKGKAFHYNPPPEHPLQAGDTLVVISEPERLAKLRKMLA